VDRSIEDSRSVRTIRVEEFFETVFEPTAQSSPAAAEPESTERDAGSVKP
jgi:hypothetical protein